MHPNQCAARVGYDLGRQLIDKDHSSTWSTTSPATPSTLALLPASAAGYFQALYHTDDGLLKALHHVPAYLLEFSSNHWISPSPSASTQCSSSPTSPRLNFQRAAPKSPVLSPSLKDTYVFYTSKFQLQGPRTPASSLSQSQRAAPSHIGPRSAVINAFRLQNYLNGQSFYLWHRAQGALSQDPEDSQRSAKFRSWMILTALHRRTESGCHSPHFLRIVYKKTPGCARQACSQAC